MPTPTAPPSANPISDLANVIRDRAASEGFAACGITSPNAIAEDGQRLFPWLAAGRHGEMSWMAERAGWRSDPTALWPAARSVIMLGEDYGPAHDPLSILSHPDRAAVSVYAQNRDYHTIVKRRLKRLGRWLVDETCCDIKVFVDTAPVMEKPMAAAAGLGWQGKHTNLVSRQLGSWFFLGAIFTTLDLPADTPHDDRCGACRRCLDICPTAAFPAPYQLDAQRCISYLTIELKGPIPRALRPAIGNRIYGCDDCLAVCPWNKFAQTASEAGYWARAELQAPRLADLVTLDDAAFRALFTGSPIKRIGRARFIRNVLIALGNTPARAAVEAIRPRLDDASPLVRGAAVWALSRHLSEAELALLRSAEETDADVLAEWDAALGATPPAPSSAS
ncbi:MAG: tRNA epoxyqueuosine(34) reductase QueG [Pseudomonadota bacterium]